MIKGEKRVIEIKSPDLVRQPTYMYIHVLYMYIVTKRNATTATYACQETVGILGLIEKLAVYLYSVPGVVGCRGVAVPQKSVMKPVWDHTLRIHQSTNSL